VSQSPLFENFLKTHANIEYIQINDREYEMPLIISSLRFYKGAVTVEIHETDGYDDDSSYRPIQIEG